MLGPYRRSLTTGRVPFSRRQKKKSTDKRGAPNEGRARARDRHGAWHNTAAAIVDSFPSHYSNQPRPDKCTVCPHEISIDHNILSDEYFRKYSNDSSQTTHVTTLTDMCLARTTTRKVSDMIPATSGHAMTDDTARTNKQVYLPSGAPRR